MGRHRAEAELLYSDFYPGDEFAPRLLALVEDLLSIPGDPPPVPPEPVFE